MKKFLRSPSIGFAPPLFLKNYLLFSALHSIDWQSFKVSMGQTESKKRPTRVKHSLRCDVSGKGEKVFDMPCNWVVPFFFFWWIIVQCTSFNRLTKFQSVNGANKTKKKRSWTCQRFTQMWCKVTWRDKGIDFEAVSKTQRSVNFSMRNLQSSHTLNRSSTIAFLFYIGDICNLRKKKVSTIVWKRHKWVCY